MNIKHYLMAISLIFILSVNCFAFADEPSAWAVDEVENAVETDLIPDNLQSNYTQSITREEFCILAIKMIEVKTGMSIEDYIDEVGVVLAPLDTFADTSNISVRAAKTLGITDGTSATEFSPNALLNREQAAKFLTSTSMACGSIVDLSTPVYSDVEDIAVWARPYTGYVYDIDVMKGVGEDKFNPKGSFQRQQAFMTINRLFNEIDSINTIRVGEMLSEKANLVEEVEENTEINDSVTLDDIEELLYSKNQMEEYYMEIEGTFKDPYFNNILKYDIYHIMPQVRVDEYGNSSIIVKTVYNYFDEFSQVVYPMESDEIEIHVSNVLPIQLLDKEFIAEIDELGFEANYTTLEGEIVLKIKYSPYSDNVKEYWFSEHYKIPLKFIETDYLEDGEVGITEWTATVIRKESIASPVFDIEIDRSIDEESMEGGDVIESKRELLFYKADRIIDDQVATDGTMNLLFYYSEASFEDLVNYFDNLLMETDDYAIYAEDKMTSIDGTLNGEMIAVMIINYMKTEPEVGMNGVNIYY